MRAAPYGRIVFGAAATLFGAIALMWRDADTWQSLMRILDLPFGNAAGEVLMIAQIAAGLALVVARMVRRASLVLAVVYGVFALVCIPGIAGAPHTYAAYGSFFEQFSLLCGAVAAYATARSRAVRSGLARATRFGLGLCAVSFALAQAFYLHFTASLVPTWLPPSQTFWAYLTTAAFALAAIAMLVNVQSQLAIRSMALMIALFGVFVWVPRLIADPASHGYWSEFALTALIAGASWLVADARPGAAPYCVSTG